MEQTIREAFINGMDAVFNAVGTGANDEVRGLALQQGMTITPILRDAADVHTQTIPAQNGQPARTFAYIDTEEGVRLSVTALTRRGNGLRLQSGKVRDAFVEVAERIIDHPGYQLNVRTTYSRPGNGGQMNHQHVFTEIIPA